MVNDAAWLLFTRQLALSMATKRRVNERYLLAEESPSGQRETGRSLPVAVYFVNCSYADVVKRRGVGTRRGRGRRGGEWRRKRRREICCGITDFVRNVCPLLDGVCSGGGNVTLNGIDPCLSSLSTLLLVLHLT